MNFCEVCFFFERAKSPSVGWVQKHEPGNLNVEIKNTDLLVAAPITRALEETREELAEARELAPGSAIILTLARVVKRLEAALDQSGMEMPRCSTEEAADILGVTTRQATKLAKADKIRAWQNDGGCRWTFDVRSCHSYASSKGCSAA